jgi:hypothetical protein
VSKAYVSKALRRRVADQARHRCGYCLTPETITGTPMEIEHIVPESRGGLTVESNLWLACKLCNDHKGERVEAPDPLTDEVVRLYNPRTQRWSKHFTWTPEGTQVIGMTPTGRATVVALKLNRSVLVDARQVWVAVGLHPPEE